MLDHSTARKAILRLAELARANQIELSLTIYGGTVMMLAYNARPGTQDIDAIFRPRDVVAPLIAQVALELGLPGNWLNDDVKAWVGENEQGAFVPFPELAGPMTGISIRRASAKYMLALKARASRLPSPGRKGDYDDLIQLLRHTQTTTIEEVDKVVERYFLHDCLPQNCRTVVETALKDAFPPEKSETTRRAGPDV